MTRQKAKGPRSLVRRHGRLSYGTEITAAQNAHSKIWGEASFAFQLCDLFYPIERVKELYNRVRTAIDERSGDGTAGRAGRELQKQAQRFEEAVKGLEAAAYFIPPPTLNDKDSY